MLCLAFVRSCERSARPKSDRIVQTGRTLFQRRLARRSYDAPTQFARLGLRVCIADLGEERLARAAAVLSGAAPDGAASVMAMAADVSRIDDVEKLELAVRQRFGGIDVLMNNAGVQPGSGMFGPAANWQNVIGVNLWGVIHGTQVFVPGMIEVVYLICLPYTRAREVFLNSAQPSRGGSQRNRPAAMVATLGSADPG
jgi:NAD(P)-dependent dehydrogenase (short-subunit alcohol dehydrogenase family)